MAAQEKSADRLVKAVLVNPDTLKRFQASPEAVLKEVAAGLPAPSPQVNNWIWIIVIIAFSIVMVGAASVLFVGMFLPAADATKQITRADTVLTIFTTVVGFLAGVLTPSPIQRSNE